MAGNTSKAVPVLFQSMTYEPVATSSTATAQAWLDHHSRSVGLFINGKFVKPLDRQTCSILDSKGGTLCSTFCAVEDDICQCISSAVQGYKAWSDFLCSQRAKVLLRMVSALEQHGQCVSELCELCEATYSSSTLVRLLQYYSSWAQLRDSLIKNWTPVGVVAVVISDDCTLYSLMLKVLPALAMGNSVIAVPGRSTALPVLLLAQLFMGAGLAAGAFSVLTGSDVMLGVKVAQNSDISHVTFSGNKQHAVILCKATAGMGIPVSLSLSVGAVCPIIIFESADIHSAVDGVIEMAFKKKKKEVHLVLYVQESILESVVANLRLRMAGMKCVDLPSEKAKAQADAVVQKAQHQGAMLLQACVAPSSCSQYPPTVLCGMAPSSPCVVTPSPGPLLPLITFRSNAEAVTLGNHSPQGQAASIWTEDLTLALETAKSLSVGLVWVNSHSVYDPCLPVSGHRDSGTCTDGGQEGLYQFLRPSSFSLQRSYPVTLDYTKFGTAPSPPIVPDGALGSLKSYPHYVGGKACKSESGCCAVVQSLDGAGLLAYYPDGGQKDIRNATEAAIKVQPSWMKKSPSARAKSLHSLAKGLETKRQDIAEAINVQTGLSLEEANLEIELSISRLSDWAAYCDKVQGGTPPLLQSGCGLSFPEALGVVGIILPSKPPLLSMVTLLGAAIVTGNAVIMVPSQKYPLPALAFIQVLQSSDLPEGLVNIITGRRDPLTVALANHSVIKAIWYCGSTEGCQYLQYTCTSPLKTLRLFCQKDEDADYRGRDWTNPSVLEEMWRNAVQWKSVWIPTA
ncbi:aldehyde dehydrogenase family 16 member A1 [Aulostomus maculatus]